MSGDNVAWTLSPLTLNDFPLVI